LRTVRPTAAAGEDEQAAFTLVTRSLPFMWHTSIGS